nr:hypothetical protein [Tanacetum cinerariifolium]
MVRDSVQLETAVNTITHEYLLEFTSEYGISEMLRPELPGPEDRIVDFPEGKVGVYTRVLTDTHIPAVRYRRCQGYFADAACRAPKMLTAYVLRICCSSMLSTLRKFERGVVTGVYVDVPAWSGSGCKRTEQRTKKLTIDKEFEQYFPMPML